MGRFMGKENEGGKNHARDSVLLSLSLCRSCYRAFTLQMLELGVDILHIVNLNLNLLGKPKRGSRSKAFHCGLLAQKKFRLV